MIVGFTGTRVGMTPQQKESLPKELHRLGVIELHHGDCRGADEDAHQIAVSLGIRTVGHPPTGNGLRAFCVCDQMLEPQPYLVRNKAIVVATRLLIACPEGPERLKSGTWSTVRHARRLQLPYVIIRPDGSIETEGTLV